MKNSTTALHVWIFLCAGLCLLTSQPALAQSNNLIIYTQYTSRDNAPYSDLYYMNPDGSGKTRITDFYPYSAREPAVSADGRHLAFTSNLASFKSAFYEDIFRLDLSNGSLVRVTGNEYVSAKRTGTVTLQATDDTNMNFSDDPSGLWVSFQGCQEVLNWEDYAKAGGLKGVPATTVWVKVVHSKWLGGIDLNVQVPAGGRVTTNTINLSDGNFLASQPAWSPDGSKIAGVFGHAYYDMDAFDEDGSYKDGQTPYAGIDSVGVWGIDGTEVAYQTGTLESMGYNVQPKYSPDGSRLAYCRGPLTRESIVVVPAGDLNASGTVVAAGGADLWTASSQGYADPDWSPDGSTIACTCITYDSSLNISSDIVLVDSAGSGAATRITSAPAGSAACDPDFSPDGQWVAYTLLTSKSGSLNITDFATYNFTGDIYIRNITTGEELRATDDGASVNPCWALTTALPRIDTSATTTTTPAATSCPFAATIESTADLGVLRDVKKKLQRRAPALVSRIVRHGPAVTARLSADPALKARFRALLADNRAVATALASTGRAEISRQAVADILDFLRALGENAGPELGVAVEKVLKEVEGDLPARIGVTIR